MADFNECPNDNEKCKENECKYYDDGDCELKTCGCCIYHNDWTHNCDIIGGWTSNESWCRDGEFYNPYGQ